MNDYFSRLIDFTVIAPRLLEAETPEAFEIWLEKLELIDRRALLRYLRQHRAEIRAEFLSIAQRRFIQDI